MFVFFSASRRTSNTGTLLAACLAVTLGFAWGDAARAQTTINWSGAENADYGNGNNWVGGNVPNGTTNVATIVAASNNPTLYAGSYSVNRLNVNYGAGFTMTSGDYLISAGSGNTRLSLGANSATGVASFTMNGGNAQIDGQLITTDGRSGNNSVAYYNQSGGKVFANVTGTATAPNAIQMSVTGGSVGYRTYINVTGGTTVSGGAITMGQSSSSGNAAFVTGTISGGALMATRFAAAAFPNDSTLDDQGTLRFQGGGFKFSGGQMIGSDVSARDGFRQGTTHTAQMVPLIASGTVGIQYAGGMMQIYTDRNNDGTIYYVQTSALNPGDPTAPIDPGAYTSQLPNRGVKRGLVDAGPNTGAAWTSLPDTAIKANLSTGVSPVRLDGIVTQVATIAAYDVADYNTDGVVDHGDYVYWNSQNGITYTGGAPIDTTTVVNNDLPYWGADGNGDSRVDSADLVVWETRRGNRRTDGAFQFAQDQTVNVASGTASQSDPGFTVTATVDNLKLTSFNAMNTKAFTKTGAGEFVLTGSNSWTYPTTVSQGTLRVSGSQAFVCYSSTTTVQAGATLKVDAGANVIAPRVNVDGTLAGAGATISVNPDSGIKSLVIGNSGSVTGSPAVVVSNTGSVTLSGSVPQVVNVSSLSVDAATGGKVDIGKGTINIASGSAAPIVANIVAGRNNGTWDGASGISSSAAAAQGGRAVGWVSNGGGSYTVGFAGAGDLNMNGVVDFDDVNQYAAAGLYDTGLPATWADGDYDYNGVVDFDDVQAFVSAGLYDQGPYNAAVFGGGAGVAIGPINTVPEPATWVLAALGAACAAGRAVRRRSLT